MVRLNDNIPKPYYIGSDLLTGYHIDCGWGYIISSQLRSTCGQSTWVDCSFGYVISSPHSYDIHLRHQFGKSKVQGDADRFPTEGAPHCDQLAVSGSINTLEIGTPSL